ncbi:hypothetical protein V0R50_27230 [Pseudomonas sp. 148P]|uniref:Uncharacterized protein n=1 Tax=Pseudomonas ulcerans TaxID=3115852 RepID=A0ABU7HZG2_9PSED|nr:MULTISPECIES: hypothetical protein [unclassified Pseudomonas]MEE1925484.1 hypothetical protein [Pseudomonas sp. 147P]MEE1936932.1 hypothetical protein [Pseudomonas sp. 148P]
MNAARETAMHPTVMNHEALQVLAQWLKHNGPIRVRKTDPRRLLAERYPAGLITEAELDALAGIWHG